MGFFNKLLYRKGQVEKPVTTKLGRGESFQNRYEYDAEYILIPGGRYKYQGETEKEVPNIYFAKYPVTNKRYRRFFRYFEGEEPELLKILPRGKYDKRLIEFASGIKDFRYFSPDRNPNTWLDKVRSDSDTEKGFDGEDQPVVGVQWFAAYAYCYWLSLLTAAGENLSYDKAKGLYRLPSEIEWEWAAGRGKREYPWAPDKGSPTEKLANYDQHERATTPVERYPEGATPEGLMDIAGNVWEWMVNWYDAVKLCRSVRGGSWDDLEVDLRCAARYDIHPGYRGTDVGFRVVRSKS